MKSIRVWMKEHGRVYEEHVQAFVVGHWAVHRSLNEVCPYDYTISHARLGLAAGYFPTDEGAIELAKALTKLFPEDPFASVATEDYARVKECSRYSEVRDVVRRFLVNHKGSINLQDAVKEDRESASV